MADSLPKILLCNDDGIDAPGIQAMREELAGKCDLMVVAPMYEKSGAGCSLSLSSEMEVHERHDKKGKTWGYAVDGTPADCVKFALTALEGYKPDAVISGINRGVNLGNSVFYSGTVAGAIEATLYGCRAMAVSLGCWGHPEAFYKDAAKVATALLPWFLKVEHRPRSLWNLNIPNKRFPAMKTLRITSHGTSFFRDEFELYRREGDKLFYRNVGTTMVACDATENADDHAVTAGEVSLSLLRTDLTMEPDAGMAEGAQEAWKARGK
ncbi:MAG: 5'/3'-nucleotidase SurE [Candidatus Sumerlaeia bacterium]|nr:5'/3'-nucleotidase SurE [Candidatus Sumerlaeia bacterium]